MLTHIYYPTISLGPVTVYTWGLIVATGILVATAIAGRIADRRGIDRDHVYGIVFWSVLSGLVVSRVLYVLGHFGHYAAKPLEIIMLWEGGVVFFGGLLGGLLGGWFYMRRHRMDIPKTLDAFALPFTVAFAIGRVACLVGDGGHVGKIAQVPWAVLVDGIPRHWTALYDLVFLAAWAILIVTVLEPLKRKRHLPGPFVFATTIVAYSAYRFFDDFLRTDATFLGLTGAQYGSVAAAVVFGVWLHHAIRTKGHTHT
ncbi:prolipoprotein diacylglyceryl transferase [Candidatus Woesearchaeota archaeon]|nr:prolipoprotein diacylglyceryl transferase [Candidatus Woesearchaeota archaeon]